MANIKKMMYGMRVKEKSMFLLVLFKSSCIISAVSVLQQTSKRSVRGFNGIM
jgi:hypothetical protein